MLHGSMISVCVHGCMRTYSWPADAGTCVAAEDHTCSQLWNIFCSLLCASPACRLGAVRRIILLLPARRACMAPACGHVHGYLVPQLAWQQEGRDWALCMD